MMTPGFAKPRKSLPWLPYPESDKVFVINAHDFPSAFSPAVNGKMPIAAWIPSLDTVGNGTTTLTDFAGSYDGALTNMDASTDWVANTGAGGVRALDLDGTNDRILTGNNLGLSSSVMTLSIWVNLSRVSGNNTIMCLGRTNTSRNAIYFDVASGLLGARRFVNGTFTSFASGASVSTGTWTHLAMALNGTSCRLYVNGTEYSGTMSGGFPNSTNQFAIGAFIDSNGTFINPTQGLIDDARVWDQALDATDIADLYAAGNGRGVDAS